MSHIGIVIRTLREKQGLTRQDLAKNICTEKYVYLIEKGAYPISRYTQII